LHNLSLKKTPAPRRLLMDLLTEANYKSVNSFIKTNIINKRRDYGTKNKLVTNSRRMQKQHRKTNHAAVKDTKSATTKPRYRSRWRPDKTNRPCSRKRHNRYIKRKGYFIYPHKRRIRHKEIW